MLIRYTSFRSFLLRAACVLLLVLCFLSAGAQDPAARLAKALSLLHCCRYVDWPPSAFAGPAAPMVIGIAGNDPFGPLLDSVVRGHFVKGHRVLVQRFGSEAPQGCHLLFVTDSAAAPLLQPVQGRPVLTVGDAPDFLSAGGMIRLVPDGAKVRLLVRPAAVRPSGLTISSKLLRLAKIVD